MLAIKESGFKEENEWRLVVEPKGRGSLSFRTGRFGILPYCAVPLCEPSGRVQFTNLFIGPNLEPDTARNAAHRFLDQHADHRGPLSLDLIKDSKIPYRY
jgi:hypothetical protein